LRFRSGFRKRMSSGWRSLRNSTAALIGEKTHGCPRPRNNYSGGFLDESVRQEDRLSPFCLHASTSFRSSRRSPLGRINTLANLFWASCSESAGSSDGRHNGQRDAAVCDTRAADRGDAIYAGSSSSARAPRTSLRHLAGHALRPRPRDLGGSRRRRKLATSQTVHDRQANIEEHRVGANSRATLNPLSPS
jgi:hypothetical protein